MAKQTTINAEVDRQTKVAIQRKAKDFKVSTSVIVRWALQEYLNRDRQAKEREQERATA